MPKLKIPFQEMVFLKIENLWKYYKKKPALKGISFEINQGELFALLGPNGAGKTTLIKILSGILSPSKGKILIENEDFTKNLSKHKEKIGLVPQMVNLDPDLTIEENLFIHGMLYNLKFSFIKKQINWLMDFAELSSYKNRKVKTLSGGLKRRVLIIRALLHNPSFLLLDEPTVGLDPHIRKKIWEFIKKIQRRKTTILLTTHYMEEAERLADRVAFIFEGKILKVDTPQNLIKSLGEWVVEVVSAEKPLVFFCSSKKEADNLIEKFSGKEDKIILRKPSLEDVFFKYYQTTQKENSL